MPSRRTSAAEAWRAFHGLEDDSGVTVVLYPDRA